MVDVSASDPVKNVASIAWWRDRGAGHAHDPGRTRRLKDRMGWFVETARRLFAHRLGETSLETVLRMVPTLVCLLAIYQGSSLEGSEVPAIVPPTLGHLLEYFALGLSLAIAAAGFTTTRVSVVGYLIAWCVAMVWAFSDEWHQSFVPGRFPSAGDLLVDGVGAAAGLALALVIASRGDQIR